MFARLSRFFLIAIIFCSPYTIWGKEDKETMAPKPESSSAQKSPTPAPAKPQEESFWQKGWKMATSWIKPTMSSMNYEQIMEAKNKAKSGGNRSATIVYLEKLIKLSDNLEETAQLLIELADAYFDNGDLDKAELTYHGFTLSYPSHKETEYALYRAILCNQAGILSYDRDQTKTDKTIELCDRFLQKPLFTTYQKEVEKIRMSSYARKMESELNVCLFYAKQDNKTSVDKRLEKIRSDLLPQAPEMEAQLLVFEMQIAKPSESAEIQKKIDQFRALSPAHAEQLATAEKILNHKMAYRL